MIDLTKYEVWFVTGSQHLYGAGDIAGSGGTLAAQIAAALGHVSRDLSPCKLSSSRCSRLQMRSCDLIREGEQRNQLHRPGGVDAHLLAGEDVDYRIAGPKQTDAAFAYAVWPRDSLVGHRHGFHEY